MVTLEPPELVRVSVKVLLLPVCTVPKLRLVGLAPRLPGVTPVAETAILSVGLEPLLVTAIFPLTAPAEFGANTTLNVGLLWPAVNVRGRVRPFTLRPVPVTVVCEIVTLDPPELVSVSVRVLFAPV